MFSILDQRRVLPVGDLLFGFLFLVMTSVSVSAAEYRLFVNDASACSAAGAAGSVCLVPVGSTTASNSTAPASQTTTLPSQPAATGTSQGCVVTTWNRCANGGSSNNGSVATYTPPPAAPVAAPVTAPVTAPVSPGSVAGGNLDFGSGGGNSNGRTHRVDVGNNTIAYPFTVASGSYIGQVAIAPTSFPFPSDGTGVRLWWSTTAGGSPLGGQCSAYMGAEAAAWWDQSGGTLGYGCAIPSNAGKLYLNLRACISSQSDKTCASQQSPGTTATIYLSGISQAR